MTSWRREREFEEFDEREIKFIQIKGALDLFNSVNLKKKRVYNFDGD